MMMYIIIQLKKKIIMYKFFLYIKISYVTMVYNASHMKWYFINSNIYIYIKPCKYMFIN